MSISLPKISWGAIISNLATHSTDYNYTCKLTANNPNDYGYGQLEVGYYIVDFVGHIFEIKEINYGGDSTVVRVYDLLETTDNQGPYNLKESYVYDSLYKAALLAQGKINRLDKSAEDFIRNLSLDPKVSEIDYIDFTTDLDTPVQKEGRTFYNNTKNTLSYYNDKTLVNIGQNISAGAITVASYLDNGDGSITIGDLDARLYSTDDFTGNLNEYSISGNTFTLTDNDTNYIVGDYNSGTPILKNILNVDLINESNVTPIYTIIRKGTELCKIDWNTTANGLANKLHYKDIKLRRFEIESGLNIGETGTRNVTCEAGIVWNGTKRSSLSSVNTSEVDNDIFFAYHSSGEWAISNITQYNNTQYDDGTDLQTLLPNRYAVNWVFRTVSTIKETICIVLGTDNYTLTQAENSTLPVLPSFITDSSILVGRIIVQKSSDIATLIEQVGATTLVYDTVNIHNDLLELQGGLADEYYHLSSAQHDAATRDATNIVNGLMPSGKLTNWDTAYSWGDHSTQGYITDLSSFNTDDLAEGTINLYSQWVTSGDNIYYNGGNVGIGTTTDSGYKLNIAGTGRFTGALKIGAYTLPNTDGTNTQVLQTNGSGVVSWGDGGGSGTVTSVALSTPTGLSISGSPITTSGTLALSLSTGYTIPKLIDLDNQVSIASNTTPNPTGNYKENEYYLTALAGNATFAAPSGTAINGNTLLIRIEDNGTARTLAWNAIYRVVGTTLPTTTVLGKILYIGMIYNSTDTKWDVVSVTQEA